MKPGPLAIIQARLGSTRLPRKMLMEVGGRSLVLRAYDAACAAFGKSNVVFTVPQKDRELIAHIEDFGGVVEPWHGPEWNVLRRFWTVAHKYRWHPDSVIVRITPDDPFKDPKQLVRVANGERLPVETSGEAFTLEMLDHWERVTAPHAEKAREHIGWFVPGEMPPRPQGRGWTVDTTDDLNHARERAARMEAELAVHGMTEWSDHVTAAVVRSMKNQARRSNPLDVGP